MSIVLSLVIQLTCLISLFLYKKIYSSKIRLIVLFLLFDYIIEDFVPTVWEINATNYFPLVYCLIKPVETILYLYCFLESNKKLGKIFLISVVFIFVSFTILFFSYKGLNFEVVNQYSQFQYFIISISIILYYNNLLDVDNETYLYQSPLFTYSVGLFMFSLSNILFSGFKSKIGNLDIEIGENLDAFINYGLMVIRYLSLIVSVILSTKSCSSNDE